MYFSQFCSMVKQAVNSGISATRAYTNFKLFSFENTDSDSETTPKDNTDPQPAVDDGELDDSRLPF